MINSTRRHTGFGHVVFPLGLKLLAAHAAVPLTAELHRAFNP